jgi:hypothetical protein
MRIRDLLDPPYGLTKKKILDLCRAGQLTPLIKADAGEYYPDPKAPKGWRRVFPTYELEDKLRSVCWLYYKLHKAEESLGKSNEWYIEQQRQYIARQELDRKGRRRASLGPWPTEDIAAHLPEMKRQLEDDVRDLPPQIEKLENELAAAWENIDVLDAAWAILARASVKEAEVEAIASLEGA